MADERDPKVTQRYRELGVEEPPRHIDEAILAASRRAADVHPAPLVPPTGRRRWYFPLAAAAVIVLSVAVTWHMQVEEPDPYGYATSAPAPVERKPVPAQQAAEKQERADEARLAQQREAPAREKREAQAKPQAAPPPEVAASRVEPRMRESAPIAGARGTQAPAADALFRKQLAEEPPEKALERIAEMRKDGKHEEAEKALEEFRKRYPGYKIPESALKK